MLIIIYSNKEGANQSKVNNTLKFLLRFSVKTKYTSCNFKKAITMQPISPCNAASSRQNKAFFHHKVF